MSSIEFNWIPLNSTHLSPLSARIESRVYFTERLLVHLHAADHVPQDAKQLQEGGVAWQRHLPLHGAARLKAISPKAFPHQKLSPAQLLHQLRP